MKTLPRYLVISLIALLAMPAFGATNQVEKVRRPHTNNVVPTVMLVPPPPPLPVIRAQVVRPPRGTNSIGLAWNLPNGTNGLTAMRVRMGYASGHPFLTNDVPPGSNCTVMDICPTRPHVFTVSAVGNAGAESPLSNEAYYNANLAGEIYQLSNGLFLGFGVTNSRSYTVKTKPALSGAWQPLTTVSNQNGFTQIGLGQDTNAGAFFQITAQ